MTVYNEVFDANKNAVQGRRIPGWCMGKVSEDRFYGGLRITAEKAMRHCHGAHPVRQEVCVLADRQHRRRADQDHPVASSARRRACRWRCATRGDGIDCEVQWPDEWRVAPADALKQSLFDRLGARSAAVEY